MKEIYYLCAVFIKLVYRMDAKKILFIAQEITPYLPESEIATICRNLPQGIQERGREIRTSCLNSEISTSDAISCTK